MTAFLDESLSDIPDGTLKEFVGSPAFAAVILALEGRKKALMEGILSGSLLGVNVTGILLREQELGRALESETFLECLKELSRKLTQN